MEARREKLRDLERKYQESLRVLEMVEASRKPTGQTTMKAPFLNAAGVMVREPSLAATAATTGLGLPAGFSREARIAQLKTDIALASIALETAPTQRATSLVGLPEQAHILAALSQTRRAATQSQELDALNQILARRAVRSLPADIGYLRAGNTINLEQTQQLKRVLLDPPSQAGSSSAQKRFKLI